MTNACSFCEMPETLVTEGGKTFWRNEVGTAFICEGCVSWVVAKVAQQKQARPIAVIRDEIACRAGETA